jgi:HK97 family phage prohead protease
MAPYFISDIAEGCDGWATVKDDGEVMGCHTTKQDAIDQGVAIALAEDSTFEGERALRAEPDALDVGDFVSWNSAGGRARGRIEQIERDGTINVPDSDFTVSGTEDDPAALIRVYRPVTGGWRASDVLVAHKFSTLRKISPLPEPPEDRDLPENYRPATSEDVPEGRACGNCIFFNEERLNDEGQAWCERWQEFADGGAYCNAWEPREEDEQRQVDLTPPAYMRASARRGLEWHREGLSGEGVVDRTIREAEAMSRGVITADKWVRLRAWISRHLVDMDAPANMPGNDDYPGPGAVAMALWGGGGSKRSAERAFEYADGVVGRIEAENEGRAKGEALSKMETRIVEVTEFEVREDGDGMRLEGYAALFNSRSENLGGFTETIKPGAFRASLRARNDIKLLWNHDTGAVLGSTRAGTLTLTEDDRGLRVSAMLPNTSYGRDARELVSRGDVSAFSFGFSMPTRGGDEWSADGTERVLKSVRLHEVSLVAFPAYPETAGTATVRGLDKVAKRAEVDADSLADALLKIENGEDISTDDRQLLEKVISELAPEAVEPEADKGLEMLALKKKKLQLLMGL